MRQLATIVLALTVCACGAATPVSYRSGTHWTIPMVDPLAGDRVAVPVMIHGQGPFVFVLDPGSPSLIDRGVAERLGLYTHGVASWVRFEGNQGHRVLSLPYEVLAMTLGTLELSNTVLYSVPSGTLGAGGRRIDGVIGRDLLTSSIVIDVDRDAGEVALALTGHSRPLRGATAIATRKRTAMVVPVALDGRALTLAVDLGLSHSTIWPWRGRELGLPLAPTDEVVLDSLGLQTHASAHARVDHVAIGGVATRPTELLAYDPNPLAEITFDGLLGEDLLSRFFVRLDRDREVLWLAPRRAALAALTAVRLARWGTTFARCAAPGCVALTIDRAASTLALTRETGAPAELEIFAQALGPDGRPLPAPLLRLDLGRGDLAVPLGAAYAAAARFQVVDASPFRADHGAPLLTAARSVDAAPRPR